MPCFVCLNVSNDEAFVLVVRVLTPVVVYILRKALVDGITIARYNERTNPRFYSLFFMVGITIYTVTVCSKLGLGAVLDTTVHIVTEILFKQKNRKV